MPDEPISTFGINQFHNAESFRCDIVIASNPVIVGLACRSFKVVYPIKYKSYASYTARNPNPRLNKLWFKLHDRTDVIITSIDAYTDEEGEWLTFTNAYGKKAALTHQQNYSTIEKAVQAVIEDANSGALREKIRCKRNSARHGHGRQSARSAGGRVRQ